MFITNPNHGYENVNLPICQLPYKNYPNGSTVKIGSGSWIGAHVCIIGNVKIGKHCVIGAGAVVNKDIPDYSVAVGVPAKIIKKYDFEKKQWVKLD